MANTYTWAINALDVHPTGDNLSNVVYNIHWGMTAASDQTDSDGDFYSANAIGTQTIVAPVTDFFTLFDDLTLEIVEGWLEASDLDIDAIKAGLDAQIVEKITPTSETKNVPW